MKRTLANSIERLTFVIERGALEHRARDERTFDTHRNWIEEGCLRWPRGCGGVCDDESEATSVTSRTPYHVLQ